MKKKIFLIIILIVIIGSIYYLEQGKVKPTSISNNLDISKQPLKDGKYSLAPELTGITGYINTKDGLQIKDFRGKVVLVDFWTYTCINCIRTLPHLTAWDKKYRDQGLVIIGVHTPEFGFEKDKNNVINAMKKHGIEYGVVQDNNYATWKNFKNRYWPRKYLIDSEGYIRYDHIGEGAYDQTEKKIQELLGEIDKDIDKELTNIPDKTPTVRTTPELYAGYDFALPRGQNIGNKEGLQPKKITNYKIPSTLKNDLIYLDGKWLSKADNLESKGESSIILSFTATSVNIVADNLEKVIEMEVLLDGKYISKNKAGNDVRFDGEKSFILINEPRLYNVVDNDLMESKLELKISEGFTFNAFTFG